MFKTFLAALAAACLVAVLLTSLGLADILGPAGLVLWVVGLILLSLLVLHRRRAAVVLLAILGASVALSGCGTLGGLGSPVGLATNGNTQQILDNLDKINTAAAQHCTGAAHIAWNPPFPPTGSMNLDCYIQPPGSVIMGQGGSFGGGGATGVLPAALQAAIDNSVAKAVAAKQ